MKLSFKEVKLLKITINRGMKYRICPTKEQGIHIIKNLGCKRFVFNHFLNLKMLTAISLRKPPLETFCNQVNPRTKEAFEKNEKFWATEKQRIKVVRIH